MADFFSFVVSLIVFVVLVRFIYWLIIRLPADMARERHRDPIAWVLVSLLGSPFLAIPLLLFLGDAK